jgi:diguanylate cyclase (GGDEF)-like protein
MASSELSPLTPSIQGRNAFCIPILAGERFLGMVILLEMDIPSEDALLLQLISGKAAMKLLQIRREEELALESTLSRKLISMVSALSLTENSGELFRNILDMATNLLRAASGSIMMLDQAGGNLKIEAVKGMNPQVARNMTIKAGAGIAGKVLSSGNPLVVNDIETDQRIGYPNRPRFRTKSFISYPIRLRDLTIGVINLADKENNAIFTEDDLKILGPFITHATVMIERSRSLERNSLLERLSVTDPLTGLYNRRFQVRRMEEELSRSTRQETSLTVMLIDLDNFKMYNDLCGHVAGDRALKKIADILRESVREMDVVTRYGGEEFCVILPGTTKKESLFVAERIRREVEKEIFPGEENLPSGSLTASIGISSFPEDGATPNALVNSSDIALYRAKSQGRNRIVLYSAELMTPESPPHEGISLQQQL